jgi:hypothetical protein
MGATEGSIERKGPTLERQLKQKQTTEPQCRWRGGGVGGPVQAVTGSQETVVKTSRDLKAMMG